MKVLIVICALVLLLQIGALGLGFSTGDGDTPRDEDEIEEGNWDPKEKVPVTAGFEGMLDPFRPRLELRWTQEDQFFRAGITTEVAFEKGHEDRRVAKFELTGGTGVLIRYECSEVGRGYRCPQVTCLYRSGQAPGFGGSSPCEDREGRCPTKGNPGEIVVYNETGMLRFCGLGDAGGTVRQR